MYITAHGNPGYIQFGESWGITGVEPKLQVILKSIKPQLNTIFLRSCSTGNTSPRGRLNPDTKDIFIKRNNGLKHEYEDRCLSDEEIEERMNECIAQRLALLCPGVEVIAPKETSSANEVRVTVNPGSSKIPLRFSFAEHYYCRKKRDYTAVFKVSAKT